MTVDKNVENVRRMLLQRSIVGVLKYGTTTERPDFNFVDWVNELQQELLDAAVYCEAMKGAYVDFKATKET